MNFSKFWKNDKREIVIVLAITLIAILTAVYSNFLAKRLEDQEKSQMVLWANAIAEKSAVLEEITKVSQKLREEERKKVEITSKTMRFILHDNNSERLALYIDILKLNTQIPFVITDTNLVIIEQRNASDEEIKPGYLLSRTKHNAYFKNPPIQINLPRTTNLIYYRDSKLYRELTELMLHSTNQFLREIKNNISSMPIILLDSKGQLIEKGNIPREIELNPERLENFINELKGNSEPISIAIDPKNTRYLYYQSSPISKYLKWFPLVLYGALALLLMISYTAIKNTRKFEKNQIWVGMSKETAHQLGTPISSLTAWLEVLGDSKNITDSEKNILNEMRYDVNRLGLIADRFSKIGSKPKLEPIELSAKVVESYNYLKSRASKHIEFILKPVYKPMYVMANHQLLDWVLENVSKNAFDAIGELGIVEISLHEDSNKYIVEIKDTGKGIPSEDFERVFDPGFTTKKRGWGLGLSLCKRIIEEYFNGKIFVKNSRLNHGTTMRIELNKSN